jgi:hypothetical protein
MRRSAAVAFIAISVYCVPNVFAHVRSEIAASHAGPVVTVEIANPAMNSPQESQTPGTDSSVDAVQAAKSSGTSSMTGADDDRTGPAVAAAPWRDRTAALTPRTLTRHASEQSGEAPAAQVSAPIYVNPTSDVALQRVALAQSADATGCPTGSASTWRLPDAAGVPVITCK